MNAAASSARNRRDVRRPSARNTLAAVPAALTMVRGSLATRLVIVPAMSSPCASASTSAVDCGSAAACCSLAEITAATPVPLVLHGASGLPAEDLLGAVELGVVKVNVNAELRRAYFEAVRSADVGDDLRTLQTLTIEAMAAVAAEKIELLAGRS